MRWMCDSSSDEGRWPARSRVFARVRLWYKRRVNGPCNIPCKKRGRGKSRRHGSGIDGVREVTEEAALVVVMMLAGRRLLLATRAAGHDRTMCRRVGRSGLHRKAAPPLCKDLHQECQQKYWQDRFRPAPQRCPPLFTSP
jgi:hypothetical protein